MKRKLLYTCAIIAVALISVAATSPALKLGRSIETLINIMREVSAYYVEETEPEKLLEDAAAGLTAGLDPYTTWMPADEMDDFKVMATGKYGGIGSVIRKKGDYIAVAQPYKGSPADKAGLVPGDRFVEVDGHNVVGVTTEEVSNLLKGNPNTTFTARVLKLVSGREETVRITRQRITIPSVPYYDMIADGVGFIQHSDFSEGGSAQVRAALEDLRSRGPLKGLILDYRGNGGGILQEAVEVVSMFVPKGTEAVSTRGRQASMNETYNTSKEPVDQSVPIVVLTSSGSASAAEIVAGALQDLDRAVLMGQRTYGKGLVQVTRPVGYGSYLKVTTAKYYTPSGRCIQAVDYAHRNDDGSVSSIPDSLINEFTTVGGRKVYDGGGVMPDIRMEPEYWSMFTAIVYARGFIDDFCDDYTRAHPESKAAPYDDFVAWMDDKDVEYESETRRALELLRTRAKRDLYYDAIEDEIASIERKLHDDKRSSLVLCREQIERLINDNLVMRHEYMQGVTARNVARDKEVAAAVELLGDAERYGHILASQDTARK